MSANVGDEIKSLVWGNKEYPVTQAFGVYNPANADMYAYAADQGWAAGTHIGLDVGVPKGTDIFAAEPGKVIQAGMSDSFRPEPVWIEEEDGQVAIYGHLWTNTVQAGDTVTAGQKIGTSGEQTERGTFNPDGTGPHIHFELRDASGKAVDPTDELTGATGTLTSMNPTINKLVIVAAIAAAGFIVWRIAK